MGRLLIVCERWFTRFYTMKNSTWLAVDSTPVFVSPIGLCLLTPELLNS